MPPPAIVNPDEVDCSRVLYSREQIYKVLPQAYEFSQLDGIVYMDTATGIAVAYRDIRADEWWCRGHLPVRPIFPGILMVESVAQLAAFYREIAMPGDGFMGFGGIDQAKFRAAVIPPCRLILMGRALDLRKRRFISEMQGYVNGQMVFEGQITGMPVAV